ncbi:glycoside hydrolase family 13 protein [uncultured Clostridium sp.]|uniref:glycoside hydrolase family 13 protein n=1 Tax=uncultured Clostridium sp. TaxID=59620 RepID=UPI0025D373F0|nr:glycoside hydrolase family 13 protein [uncultured Clostridium sp.]
MELDDIQIFHDSHNLELRNPFGAVSIGNKVRIRLWTSKRCLAYINLINFYNNQIEIQMNEIGWNDSVNNWIYEVEVDTSNNIGLIYYYFRVSYYGRNIIYGNNIESLGGIGQIYFNEPISYQITIYSKKDVPSWYREGIIYQIFVDRFFNGEEEGKVLNPKKNTFIYGNWDDSPMYIKDMSGNIVRWDFYGGNLLGVKKKLKYIKSLGVSVIYFNPIFDSPSCHKYDTGDYEKIDPMFGDEEIFKDLCREAEKLGMRIILDGVFSHTGSDSKYFNKFGNYDSLGAYQSLQSPYYRWYRFNDYPKLYETWWGFSNMPNVDELNPSYLDYIIRNKNSVIEKWLKLGAGGWRLDVADELPDEFIKILKKKLKEVKSDGVLIGEVWEDASNKVSYNRKREYLFGNELDSVTNYPLRQIILDLVRNYIGSKYFIRKYLSLKENYPKEYFYSTMNMLGNHDTERVLTMLNNNVNLLKEAVVIQMTLPGVPLIYYGDEAGLTGGKDPDNRKSYPWGKENKDILEFYKKISAIRVGEEALKSGEIEFLENNNGILGYERILNSDRIIIVVNMMEKEENILIDNIDGDILDLLDKDKEYVVENRKINILIKAHEFIILKVL